PITFSLVSAGPLTTELFTSIFGTGNPTVDGISNSNTTTTTINPPPPPPPTPPPPSPPRKAVQQGTLIEYLDEIDIGGTFLTATEVPPVPGRVVGAGIPGLILGCGVLLALARRRRKLVA